MPALELPKRLEAEVKATAKELGFRNETEFVRRAVEEKLIEVRKAKSFERTDLIRKRLEAKDITQEEILKDFEKRR